MIRSGYLPPVLVTGAEQKKPVKKRVMSTVWMFWPTAVPKQKQAPMK